MRNLNIVEMEANIGGSAAIELLDGVACGIGIGFLCSGFFSWLGAVMTAYGCARALELI